MISKLNASVIKYCYQHDNMLYLIDNYELYMMKRALMLTKLVNSMLIERMVWQQYA